VHGAAQSLRASLLAVLLASVIGSLVGLVSGFAGGWVDGLIMRVIDVLLAVPALLLSLAFVTALGFGTTNVAIAVGLAAIARFARIMRAEVLRISTSLYVEAARACGARRYSILARHVLPNAYGPVVALATLQFGLAILAVSALSFLGYGATPPAPEWGSLVAQGRDYLGTAWWLTTLPGLTVAATVLATNRIARAIDGEWSAAR
ncbi:MAG TPA: ABC transporter permease, partial [Jatrophihabitantaceae bacterium]|nr:ABC transporter permease [Jatrophihabitantaceae bacterium]